jgi:hypothetical protein
VLSSQQVAYPRGNAGSCCTVQPGPLQHRMAISPHTHALCLNTLWRCRAHAPRGQFNTRPVRRKGGAGRLFQQVRPTSSSGHFNPSWRIPVFSRSHVPEVATASRREQIVDAARASWRSTVKTR